MQLRGIITRAKQARQAQQAQPPGTRRKKDGARPGARPDQRARRTRPTAAQRRRHRTGSDRSRRRSAGPGRHPGQRREPDQGRRPEKTATPGQPGPRAAGSQPTPADQQIRLTSGAPQRASRDRTTTAGAPGQAERPFPAGRARQERPGRIERLTARRADRAPRSAVETLGPDRGRLFPTAGAHARHPGTNAGPADHSATILLDHSSGDPADRADGEAGERINQVPGHDHGSGEHPAIMGRRQIEHHPTRPDRQDRDLDEGANIMGTDGGKTDRRSRHGRLSPGQRPNQDGTKRHPKDSTPRTQSQGESTTKSVTKKPPGEAHPGERERERRLRRKRPAHRREKRAPARRRQAPAAGRAGAGTEAPAPRPRTAA